jgi:hypothetical protein
MLQFFHLILLLGADLNGLDTCPRAEATQAVPAAEVREVLKAHAGQINTKDIKTGGTLLHWAVEKATMETFIGKGLLPLCFQGLCLDIFRLWFFHQELV